MPQGAAKGVHVGEEIAPVLPLPLARVLSLIYSTRPCWICKQSKWCGHREPLVDIAEFARKFDAYEPKPKGAQ